jgi:hypothetical protein
MSYATLYQRPCPAQDFPAMPPQVRIEHYIDPAGRACPQCGRIVGRRDANELTARG